MLLAKVLGAGVPLGAREEEEDEVVPRVVVEVTLVAVALAVVGELREVELERVEEDDRDEVEVVDVRREVGIVDAELVAIVVGRTGERVLLVPLVVGFPLMGASLLSVMMLESAGPRTGARVAVCCRLTLLFLPFLSLLRSTGLAMLKEKSRERRKHKVRKDEADRAAMVAERAAGWGKSEKRNKKKKKKELERRWFIYLLPIASYRFRLISTSTSMMYFDRTRVALFT